MARLSGQIHTQMSGGMFVICFVLLNFVVPLTLSIIIVNYIIGDVTWHTVLATPYYMPCVFVTFFIVRYCSWIFIHLFFGAPS